MRAARCTTIRAMKQGAFQHATQPGEKKQVLYYKVALVEIKGKSWGVMPRARVAGVVVFPLDSPQGHTSPCGLAFTPDSCPFFRVGDAATC